MAPPPEHKKIQFAGTLQQAVGGGSEIFSFSMADNSALTPHDLAIAAGTYAVAHWDDGTGIDISYFATLTKVVVENIAADGTVISSYTNSVTPTPGIVGAGYPTILSTAVTLETGMVDGHGRKIRGRFYPPATVAQVTGSTSVLEEANNFATGWAGFIHGLNNAGAAIAVATTTTGGAIVPVTGVSVDTVIDTVRRRKNHVTSQRSSVHSVL